MTSQRRRTGRRAAAVGFSAVGAVVALASAAFACTMIMGITKISNPGNGSYTMIDKSGLVSGPGVRGFRNATLKVAAWELPAGATFELWFVWPKSVKDGVGCHTVTDTTGVIMKSPSGAPITSMLADPQGSLDANPNKEGPQAYKAVIPNDIRAKTGGTAEICGREIPPWKGQWESATQHAKLTIL